MITLTLLVLMLHISCCIAQPGYDAILRDYFGGMRKGIFIALKRLTRGDLLQESRKSDFFSWLVYLQLLMDPSAFMMPLPYCIYILFSRKDLLLYIGYTTNIEQRVMDHNCGKAKSTAPRRPLELIFCEFYLFESDARRREMYFKTTAGKKAIKLMLWGTLLKFGYNRTALWLLERL